MKLNKIYLSMSIPFIIFMSTMILLFLNPSPISFFINFSLFFNNSINLEFNMILDWMTMIFFSTVLIITLFISLYSHTYIPTKEQSRFMLIMFMFALSMMILIISNNLLLLLLGWDGLGLTSYILVIYYQNAITNSSGSITILSNRIGDIALLISFAILSSLNLWNIHMNMFFPYLIMILFVMAAITKSAQFPFSAWLPAAMAAPTPISALVHSSTLVTAGVFLMIRLSSNFHPTSMWALIVLSTFTTFYASMSALWEQDMKKTIALSTLSQIAIMMFAVALGSSTTAFFHLITHAMFKSTMFLCAGNIIHNSTYQDTRMMGSMYKQMPTMSTTLGISSMALAGLPFTAGFFSKDAIMEFMLFSSTNFTIMMIMISSISMTTMYTIRMINNSNPMKSKTKPDILLSNNNLLSWPPLTMAPLSLIMGSTIAWMIPSQTLTLPPLMYITISMMIILGITLSMTFSYKSKIYNIIGKFSISMWFIHHLSTTPWLKMLHSSTLLMKMDNTWQEQITAQGLFKFLKKSNFSSMISLKSPLLLTFLLMSPFVMKSKFSLNFMKHFIEDKAIHFHYEKMTYTTFLTQHPSRNQIAIALSSIKKLAASQNFT